MKLTVLGKYGPYGKPGVGAASGYLISDKSFRLLCDMGSGIMSRLLATEDITKLSGIFISHLHYDHTSDLLPFRYRLDELQTPIKIFTHREIGDPYYDLLFNHPLMEIVDIDENTEITLDGVKLSFFAMDHKMPAYAIRCDGDGSIMYTGDTVYNDNIIKGGKGCDIILADCSKPEVFIGAHMPAKYAFLIREKTGATIIATHLAPDFSPEKIFSDADGILVAEEGKTYDTEKYNAKKHL